MDKSLKFFDKFSRFYTTSLTSPFPDRLNGRYEAIIARNAELLKGKRVLDIASHDGRWTFAALQAGASYVRGVEPRQELIDNATETFAFYGVDDRRFDFLRGDIFDLTIGESFDVVLCLGFFYHTIRHAELLSLIDNLDAELVVVDTEVVPRRQGSTSMATNDPRLVHNNPHEIQLLREQVDDQQMACSDSLTRNGYTIVGRPSSETVRFLAEHFGYSCSQFDWHSYFLSHPQHAGAMPDYMQGWRETFYLSKRER